MPADPPASVILPGKTRPAPGTVSAYPALDLLDEAFHRLRLAPPGLLGIYYAGTLPFVLLLLYFVADQSHSADAAGHAVGGTLAVAALFLVMKIAHALFAVRLNALLRREPATVWTWMRFGRLAAVQTVLQPSGLFLMTLASIPVVPLPWVYAWYQNVTVLGDGTASTRSVLRRATRATLRWPRQNHTGLSILSLIGLFVMLNLVIAVLGVPYLLRMFTGEENLFTRNGWHILNTTFFAVVSGLGYLALDPLVKAFYTLRCFYEESLRSGDDLLSDLAALPPVATSAAAVTAGEAAGRGTMRGRTGLAGTVAAIVLLAAWGAASPVRAADSVPAATPAAVGVTTKQADASAQAVSPPALGRSINDVLGHRKFAWRLPRKDAQTVDGPMDSFFKGVGDWLHARWVTIRDGLDAAFRWIKKWFKTKEQIDDDREPSGGILNAATTKGLLIALAAVLVGTILYVSGKELRRRRASTAAGRAVPAGSGVPVPDLRDDTVLATQLPEDEWLRLAQALLQKGERRLALRAFYLSALSNLAGRGLLAIARHKSNRDYLLELRRRAREQPDLQGAFARNVARFERVWYGAHPADDALLAEFQVDRQVG